MPGFVLDAILVKTVLRKDPEVREAEKRNRHLGALHTGATQADVETGQGPGKGNKISV